MATDKEFDAISEGDKISISGWENDFIVTRIEARDDRNTRVYMKQPNWTGDQETFVARSQADGIKIAKAPKKAEVKKEEPKKEEETPSTETPAEEVPPATPSAPKAKK